MVVRMAITITPTLNGIAPLLSETANWPPTITFTADHAIHAPTLKNAIMMPPTQPKAKRVRVIWRSPNFGPRVEKNATGSTPSALKMTIEATLSQKPIPKAGTASVPSAIVEITRLAANHMVKLSKIRTWVRVSGDTRSMPCVSIPLSSGIATTSEAIRCPPQMMNEKRNSCAQIAGDTENTCVHDAKHCILPVEPTSYEMPALREV